MASLNKVLLIGNVGQKPTITVTQTGLEFARFSLATTESWKDKQTGEKKDRTEWHNVSVLNSGIVKVVKQYIDQGSKLYIEGELRTEKYQGKDGVERYITKVVMGINSKLVMLGGGKNNQQSNKTEWQPNPYAASNPNYAPELTDPNHPDYNQQSKTEEISDDEIPF